MLFFCGYGGFAYFCEVTYGVFRVVRVGYFWWRGNEGYGGWVILIYWLGVFAAFGWSGSTVFSFVMVSPPCGDFFVVLGSRDDS